MSQLIKIRDINDAMLNFSKYVNFQFFMQEFLNDISIQIKFRDQYHVISKLKINFFSRIQCFKFAKNDDKSQQENVNIKMLS